MAKNLGFGSKLIRLLLATGAVLSVASLLGVGFTGEGLRMLAGINALLFLSVLVMFARRKLASRVRRLAAVMDQAAEGELAVRGEDLAQDEVGMLNSNFNDMLERLEGIVRSIRGAAAELGSIGEIIGNVAAQEVLSAENQFHATAGLKEVVLQIRESVGEVSTAVEGLSRMATHNATFVTEMATSTTEIDTLVEQLLRSVELVSDSINRMSAGQLQVSESVNRLLETSNGTVILVAEMEQSVRQIEQSAQTTAHISADVLHDAEQGNASVESTISGIDQIRTASRTVQQAIEKLSVHAASIGTILQVIDEVTEQTKLLALNASIIAAQAGEHGKGFGVVAHEIKELARRTTASTRQIAEIVNGVTEETERAVVAINLSEQAVTEGETLSRRSGEALQKIVNGVKIATELVNEIANATEQHAHQGEKMRLATDEVRSMVEQIVRATGDQTRNAQVIGQASDSMRQLATRVHGHARAHSDAGTAVAASGEAIVRMIEEIRHACQIQSEGSDRIVSSAEQVEASATSNLETTKIMDEMATRLSSQIGNLEQALAGFKGASAS
ncbi:methyl-accepting chemotaxis protein [Trichlorobacter ammonificans]|uniref:Methyl-accepting chemotaxis sensory transducer n=1 Tax=Trichlorobacter ammonificans TaxID=2916410 RepID=A0ABM9DCA1_9BACT|nr:methyl-accepting chemotaxis protein [Trichlorobacter ammonificans]CAH2032052.1 Methyl-accepting chemotaxis sensory transducer [Trichlorobacter ammonificans]